MSDVQDDVIEVIETLKEIDEVERIEEEYRDIKYSIQGIENTLDEFSSSIPQMEEEKQQLEELLALQVEKNIEHVEISKWGFGISVLNCVLLICILISVFLSKLRG